MTQTTWTPNEKQKLFLGALADGKVLTLSEISAIVNQEIKSGSINSLIGKGLVETEDVIYDCDIIRKDNGQKVGSVKKKVKAYKLVKPVE